MIAADPSEWLEEDEAKPIGEVPNELAWGSSRGAAGREMPPGPLAWGRWEFQRGALAGGFLHTEAHAAQAAAVKSAQDVLLDEWGITGRVNAPTLVRIFHELAARWEAETGGLSNLRSIVLNHSYQQIIGLGPQVLPLLLEDLRSNSRDWFWALNAITRQDPASLIDRFDEARRTWLSWGQVQGLIS